MKPVYKWVICVILVLIVALLVVCGVYNTNSFSNTTYIPKVVYQTYFTKDLPSGLKKTYTLLKKQHPDFTFHLYDDNDCREFLKSNFPKRVLNAFDTLKPGAFKADLWRYCILYKYGGIYLDIKLACADGFRLNQMLNKEYFVRDSTVWTQGNTYVYQAVLVCQKGNPILKKCIDRVCENVEKRYVGSSRLEVTGPILARLVYDSERYRVPNLDFEEYIHKGGSNIYRNGVLAIYAPYNTEYRSQYKGNNYHISWPNNVYN